MTGDVASSLPPAGEHYCRECYSEDVIPVWEDITDFEDGLPPDWIGCLRCREMRFHPAKKGGGA